MPEPTGSLSYTDLAGFIGDFAGFGAGGALGDNVWDTRTAGRIDRVLRAGVRSFYNPLPKYDWSFLHLFTDLDWPTNAQSKPLPDDFGGIEGDIIVLQTGGTPLTRVRVMNPQRIKALYARVPAASGYPLEAAVEPLKGTTQVAGQRSQLIIYPAADQDYTLRIQYYVNPDMPAPAPPSGSQPGTPNNTNFPGIITGNPYVYGGPEHAETIKEACLAAWESLWNDIPGGNHKALFEERLAASINADRRNKPQYLGKNYDTSDEAEVRDRWWPDFPNYVLYNGSQTN